MADVVAMVVTTSALVWASRRGASPVGPLAWILVLDALTMVALRRRGLHGFRLRPSLWDELGATLACTVVAVAATITLRSLVAPDEQIARQILPAWAFLTATLLALRTELALGDRRVWRGGWATPTLIVGAGEVGRGLARRLLDRPELGLRPVGFLDKDPLPTEDDLDGPPVLGASWDLEDVVARHGVTNVVFTFSTAPHHVQLDLMRRSHHLGLYVLVVPRLFEQTSGEIALAHVGGMPVLQVRPVKLDSWPFAAKQYLDRALAGLALVITAPALLVLALAVRLTSPGPVLFRQRRMGLDGRAFEMLKFRTMTGSPETHGEADASWAAGVGAGVHGPTAGIDGGSVVADRRTRLGRFLRSASLDELPQLINVLRGEMSLIGPRPERIRLAQSFEQTIPRYADRHRVRPGITGWAQVQGLRGSTSLVDRVEWDNHYVENWTPWLDLKILFMTMWAVISGRNTS